MRVISWNCRVGGFRWKARHIAPLRPDVLAVQEVEPIDTVLLFAGDSQPTCRERIANPAFSRRAIGMFSYTGTTITPVDVAEPAYGFRRYEAEFGELAFNVVAVWTYATRGCRETSYRQAHAGLAAHGAWIAERPTVILGDFNDSKAFRITYWDELLGRLQPLGLVSAYHTFFGEDFGAETRPTYYHRAKRTSCPEHVDYCFVPEAWALFVQNVQVGNYDEWHEVSDHMPLIVDLDLPPDAGAQSATPASAENDA